MTSKTTNQVACPKCGRKQKSTGGKDALYWCNHCKGYFDNDPDEGGTYCDDPSKRIERAEQRKPRHVRR